MTLQLTAIRNCRVRSFRGWWAVAITGLLLAADGRPAEPKTPTRDRRLPIQELAIEALKSEVPFSGRNEIRGERTIDDLSANRLPNVALDPGNLRMLSELGQAIRKVRFRTPAMQETLTELPNADLRYSPAPQPLLAPPAEYAWEILWSTNRVEYGEVATPPLETDTGWQIAGESVVVLRPVAHPADDRNESLDPKS